MSVLELFIFAFIGLSLLIVHSYFKRGFRITLGVFLFAFIVGMKKEIGNFLGLAFSNMPSPAPFIHTTNYSLIFCVFNTAVGWMLMFYLSWCLAERIVNRVGYLKDKIFPTLLFAGIVIAAFAYAIEATAVNIGWWKWRFFDKHFAKFLVGGVHFFALSIWFHHSIHFLVPYFLIECSKFRKTDWRCIFFLIPLSRTWTILFLGSDLPLVIHQHISFFLLIILVFVRPLYFDYPEFKIKIDAHSFLYKIIEFIPFIVSLMILSVLLYVNIVKLKNGILIISLLPVIFLLLLAIKKVPLKFTALAGTLAFLFIGKTFIPAFIPVILLLGFYSLDRLVKIPSNK